MRAAAIYAVILVAVTAKIATMPQFSYDSYLYSYLASDDIRSFKATPGLPREYVEMADEKYSQPAPYYTVKVLFVFLTRIAARFVGVLRAPFVVSAGAYFILGW